MQDPQQQQQVQMQQMERAQQYQVNETNMAMQPQQPDQQFQQQSYPNQVSQELQQKPNYGQQAYPTQVPDEVAQAVKQQESKLEESTVLDHIPGLMGDRDRQGFIIKTYTLITIMIAVTAGFSGLTYRSAGFLTFFMNNIWLYYVSLIVVIGISVGMACHYRKFQKAPLNYILLSIYTIAHSYLIAVIIQFYKVETIAQAAAATGGMFVVLTGYACFTKGDMTRKGGLICTICECIFWIIIFQFVWGPVNKFLYMIICFAVVCLLGVFIVHDTQMIVGGTNRKFQLDHNDYVIGAIILYSDVVVAFIYMLQIFGGSGN